MPTMNEANLSCFHQDIPNFYDLRKGYRMALLTSFNQAKYKRKGLFQFNHEYPISNLTMSNSLEITTTNMVVLLYYSIIGNHEYTCTTYLFNSYMIIRKTNIPIETKTVSV